MDNSIGVSPLSGPPTPGDPGRTPGSFWAKHAEDRAKKSTTAPHRDNHWVSTDSMTFSPWPVKSLLTFARDRPSCSHDPCAPVRPARRRVARSVKLARAEILVYRP